MNRTKSDTVVVQFGKRKTFVWLIVANVFVGIGGWLLFGDLVFHNALLDNPWFIKAVGLVSVGFFGIAVYFFIGKLMARGPGLIIDDIGIEDYSSAVSVPKIYWKDIAEIEVFTIKSQPIILFKLNNPQTYIDQAKGFKRKMMEMNHKWYGTPLSISANSLDVSFEELLEMVSHRFGAYKEAK